ncbi:MAG: xanthine dehydrogenase small subunit [Woeseiaceae bacterium]|nr:xanthine dehydrogenase small subunit [Woeseiaceae bacterium]
MPRTDHVRFVLDGEVIELRDVDPTRTVLQFLREDLRRTGTKEGCAEGDCGACTVVLAELDRSGEDLVLRAVNACIQFLPTLDGKELFTVESLATDTSDLHPVQRAMVENHGAQCGFCTPGFVMSMFALYKTRSSPGRVEIDDALAGNLCRCTGYRPIVAAATSMYSIESGDDWLRTPAGRGAAPADRVDALRGLRRDAMLELQHGERRFFAPRTTAELGSVLAKHPQATILAGGTDVGLWVTKQHRDLDTVVYTGSVDSLADIRVTDTHIELGAAVTLSDAMQIIVEHFPQLDELFLRFASPPIRNAGTLGGNVANGSPIGDTMPALMAAEAELLLTSASGTRVVPLDSFYHDYMVNELQPGEFLETIRIPLLANGSELRSYKVSKRFDQDISAVCGAFRTTIVDDRVDDVRIAFGGMAATIRRAPGCEDALRGSAWNDATIDRAATALADDFEPLTDMRASAAYRLRVAQNMLRRLYLETRGDLPQTVYRYGRQG